jgi:hypothetical protein
MTEEAKAAGPTKFQLATIEQLKNCACGWACWLRDTAKRLKCCPGCVGVDEKHYTQACGCGK